jgi:hypothetical protein
MREKLIKINITKQQSKSVRLLFQNIHIFYRFCNTNVYFSFLSISLKIILKFQNKLN